MTQSSMLQSLPAPLRSILRDPTAIAVLASIGVHGLLWAVLPYLPLSPAQPTEAEIQREVGLVQLSPEELARVPQFDTPTTIPIPAVPPPVDLGRLPQQFSVTPLPTPSFPPSISSFPPDSLFVPRFPRQQSRSFPRSTAPTTTQPRRSAPTATPTPTPTATATPTPTPTPSPLPSPVAGETVSPGGTPIENVPPLAGSPTPAPTTTPSPEGTPSGNPPETPASSATPRLTPEQIADLRAQQQRDREFLGSFNIAGTSARRSEVAAAIEAWINDVTPQLQAGNSTGAVETVTIRIPTSRETCLARQQLQATYGVLIDGDGDRVGDPRLVMSSGFALLNSRALEAVRDKEDFSNETGAIQPFQVNVIFQYNAADCPSIVAPSPPASEGTS